MTNESKLQIVRRDGSSSLFLSKARSSLVARGCRDAAILPRPASPALPAPIDPLNKTRRLAEQGDSHAQFSLGSAYEEGVGVQQDFAEAAKWYRKAAESGFGIAQQHLGRLYRDGRGVPQDFAEALRWYCQASASSQPYNQDAKVELGSSYYRGIGVEHNYSEAIKWFREAIPSWMGYAEFYLGTAYATGRGVPQDYAEAVRWWLIAADGESLTNGQAHYMLGHAYRRGDGVTQDYILAYMWYALAIAYDWDEELTPRLRDDTAKRLTLQQLDKARQLAREWDAERRGPDSDIDFALRL